MNHFTQADRDLLIELESIRTFRKKARIIAVQMFLDFDVETDRGVMAGHAGDWLVTNHPGDDPGLDLWTVSAERMANTYEEVKP